MTIQLALVLAASFIAAVSDVRTRRIPNLIPGGLLLCGLAAASFSGWQTLALDLLIVGVVLLAGTFAFSFGLIGGGDVKLLAAAAGTLGYPAGALCILLTMLCGGVLAVAYAAMRGRLGATIDNVRSMTAPMIVGIRPVRPDGTPMPYAVAIFAGALCTAIVSGFAPHLRLLP